jgi:DNA-binding PadR family transcriptional regulator
MPIPEITHLQFLVLCAIGGTQRPGREVREKLAEEGCDKSLPAFYQMMARMEDAGLVVGSTHPIHVGDQTVTERRYKVTGAGHKARQDTIEFYQERELKAVRGKGGVAHG